MRAVLSACSGALLAWPYSHPAMFAVAWVGFVPLMFALRGATARQAYALGCITGSVLYIAAGYWVVEFVQNLKNYNVVVSAALAMLFWLYCAQATAIAVAAVVWLQRRLRAPAVFAWPTMLVATYSIFPTFAPVHFGETQTHFLWALQGTDVTGVFGLDFLIVMTSPLCFEWLRDGKRSLGIANGIALSVLTLWMLYGVIQTSRWSDRIAAWPTLNVGLVQPNEPPSAQIPPPRLGYSRAYPLELALSDALAQQSPDVIIWPETRYKGYFDYAHVRRSFSEHVRRLRTPLIFHDLETIESDSSRTQHNSAVFLEADGTLGAVYRKRERMPFGEYIPFVSDVPAAQEWVRRYVGDFFAPITPGDAPATFTTERFAITPLICYEAMSATFVAEALKHSGRGKILVTLTNDGWFGPTRQPYMHAYASLVRAVENRVPMVHAINNGPSMIALPNGRVALLTDPNAAAAYSVTLPYSREQGGSFFTQYPYLAIGLIWIAGASLLLAGIVTRRGRAQLPVAGI